MWTPTPLAQAVVHGRRVGELEEKEAEATGLRGDADSRAREGWESRNIHTPLEALSTLQSALGLTSPLGSVQGKGGLSLYVPVKKPAQAPEGIHQVRRQNGHAVNPLFQTSNSGLYRSDFGCL